MSSAAPPEASPPQTLRLPDERVLAFAEYGDPEGRPLLALHGTPGSRLFAACLHTAAHEAGVRVVCPDRPGCGGSDPDPSTSFTGYCRDLRALLDHLQLRRATLAAISGGGGYALAAAATMPERLHIVLLCSALLPGAPREAFAGGAGLQRLLPGLARRAPRLLAALLARQHRTLLRRDPDAGDPFVRRFPPVDRQVLHDRAVRDTLLRDATEGLRQTATATIEELARYTRPLSTPLTDITIPIEIVHGHEDRNVPVGVARWAHTRLPSSSLTLLPDTGHLLAFSHSHELFRRVV
jgi:pimeloyl-ACP methyl ester carboxylesterase